MHRKRVTSELHDSYFRLMTIKHSISKIEWASNDYIIELSSTSQSSCQEGSRQLETWCSKESHTRLRGPSGTPIEWTPASGEQERHNVTAITVGSRYYSLCSVSSSLSHATLEQPFRTLTNKVRGKYFVKEVIHASVVHCVGMYPAYICTFLHESADDNITHCHSYVHLWTNIPFFLSVIG